MSCCPEVPASAAIGGTFGEARGPESDIRKGESVECYMARSGNTTGLQDDATQNVENKIDNSSIPISQNPVRFNAIQFRLTVGSDRQPTNWSWANASGEDPNTLGVSISPVGLLNGTISSNAYKKIFKIVVTASDAAGIIDQRGYVFSPAVSNGDEISLINPLPGAIINSRFGPRMHPIYHIMKPHTGIDLKYTDRSVKTVVAAADGQVVLSGGTPSSGYGLRVWVKHTSGTGQHICTTTYNHLSKYYVQAGQRVMAGQAIGMEGSTGASTGNHLHFEVKLPDGKFIDPEPLIKGTMSIADLTLINGESSGSLRTSVGTASLTSSEVEARSAGCAAFGPSYPAGEETTDPVPTPADPGTDPFELAWFFTMQHEVGPFWNTNYPNDPDVIAGSIQTADQRKKCGYVNVPGYPGGETKFGIAQSPNPATNVRTLNYANAKQIGFNNYWKSKRVDCSTKPSLIAIMLFDMNYVHGDGNTKKILQDAINAGLSLTATDRNSQIASCEILTNARLAFIRGIPRPEYTLGWTRRANNTQSFIRLLSL